MSRDTPVHAGNIGRQTRAKLQSGRSRENEGANRASTSTQPTLADAETDASTTAMTCAMEWTEPDRVAFETFCRTSAFCGVFGGRCAGATRSLETSQVFVETTQRQCPNDSRERHRRTLYLDVTPDGVTMRCECQQASLRVLLPGELLAMLFPEAVVGINEWRMKVSRVHPDVVVRCSQNGQQGDASLLEHLFCNHIEGGGQTLAYDSERGKWYIWGQHVWKCDILDHVPLYASQALAQAYRHVADVLLWRDNGGEDGRTDTAMDGVISHELPDGGSRASPANGRNGAPVIGSARRAPFGGKARMRRRHDGHSS